ncbi:S1C family serine protease [Lysobacter korlensis]|uniref:S1C family serine protease n=1 Tax=Lysobacter korlensis TaxID=553636 RepID=A0ABV6RUZ6_9GAMM
MNTPSRLGATTKRRRALATVATLPVLAVSLSACMPFGLGTATPPAGAAGGGGGGVDFDGVQSATIQIEAIGTFVDPAEGAFEAAGRGSGFIISPDGIAVTNNHVVVGAGTLEVWRGGDTTDTLNAKVLGSSECLDLAVIDLNGDDYPYFEWRKKDITTAQDVYAAGFPLGDPTFTMTRGIVSKAETAGETPWASIDSVIEHDARIRGGNSGGPLVDPDGRIVGVNYAGNDQHDTNLAIHRDEAMEVVEQLAAGESVLSLGINAQALMGEDGTGLGIWVASVAAGSAADKAGVEPGDLLTRMQGVTLGTQGTMSEYCDVLRTHGQDAALDVELYRPADGLYYRGQFNGEAPIEAVTVLGQDGGNSGGGSGGGTTGDFVNVSDDSGIVTVDVPADWSDIDGSPFTDEAGNSWARLVASTDLDSYFSSWNTPGLAVMASQDALSNMSVDDILNDTTNALPGAGCTEDARDAFEDSYYTGTFSYWTGCGDTGASYLVVAATDMNQSHAIVVAVQANSDADLAVADRALGSFFASF